MIEVPILRVLTIEVGVRVLMIEVPILRVLTIEVGVRVFGFNE